MVPVNPAVSGMDFTGTRAESSASCVLVLAEMYDTPELKVLNLLCHSGLLGITMSGTLMPCSRRVCVMANHPHAIGRRVILPTGSKPDWQDLSDLTVRVGMKKGNKEGPFEIDEVDISG